jgi:predicted  nucleic acid-binding Zn-ribbon protein
VREDIANLIRLQKIDLKLLALDREKENCPESLLEVEKALAAKKEELVALEKEIEELKYKKREYEDELEQEYQRLRKSQNRLMEVKAQREYQALLKEIEEIKKANKLREEEILQLMSRLENLAQEKEKFAQELEDLEKRVAEERARYEAQRAEIDQKREGVLQEREAIAKNIPVTLLKRYEFIKSRRNGLAVVGVINAICDGCHMNIPPQLYNELIRDDKIHECPMCQRIIFYKKAYEEVLFEGEPEN